MVEASLKGGDLGGRNAAGGLQRAERFVEFAQEAVNAGEGQGDGVDVLGSRGGGFRPVCVVFGRQPKRRLGSRALRRRRGTRCAADLRGEERRDGCGVRVQRDGLLAWTARDCADVREGSTRADSSISKNADRTCRGRTGQEFIVKRDLGKPDILGSAVVDNIGANGIRAGEVRQSHCRFHNDKERHILRDGYRPRWELCSFRIERCARFAPIACATDDHSVRRTNRVV